MKIVSHSRLLYWWPVWAFGFLIAAVSCLEGNRLAIVPEGSTVRADAAVNGKETFELTVPSHPNEALKEAASPSAGHESFPYHILQNKGWGIAYFIVVLIVILATNVTLRGFWSIINLLVIGVVVLLFAHLHWWNPIYQELNRLPIYGTAAAYLVPSTLLFLFWTATVFLLDLRRFIIFSPGQLVVHREVGDMQAVYDTGGVELVKKRNDFVRHRLLGLGAGDLIVTSTNGRHMFELPNVLFADRKMREIAELMKTRPVIDS